MGDIPSFVSIATALGVGGAVGAWLSAVLQRRNRVSQREHDLRQTRYLCILILMLSKLSPREGMEKLHQRRPDLATVEDLDNELSLELLNAVVFAGDRVLTTLASFIRTPSHDAFVRTAIAMRQDLWGGRRANTRDLASALRGATNIAMLTHQPESLLQL